MQTLRRARFGALLAAGLVFAGLGATRLSANPVAGKPAPGFAGVTVDGKKVSLVGYKGKKAVLLNFYSNT